MVTMEGIVPVFKMLLAGTIPAFKTLLVESFLTNLYLLPQENFLRTNPISFFQIIHNTRKKIYLNIVLANFKILVWIDLNILLLPILHLF